jgi:hypothetical protein
MLCAGASAAGVFSAFGEQVGRGLVRLGALHSAHVVKIKGRSYRLMDLENALASREG